MYLNDYYTNLCNGSNDYMNSCLTSQSDFRLILKTYSTFILGDVKSDLTR